jgi:hypothetical protein
VHENRTMKLAETSKKGGRGMREKDGGDESK